MAEERRNFQAFVARICIMIYAKHAFRVAVLWFWLQWKGQFRLIENVYFNEDERREVQGEYWYIVYILQLLSTAVYACTPRG